MIDCRTPWDHFVLLLFQRLIPTANYLSGNEYRWVYKMHSRCFTGTRAKNVRFLEVLSLAWEIHPNNETVRHVWSYDCLLTTIKDSGTGKIPLYVVWGPCSPEVLHPAHVLPPVAAAWRSFSDWTKGTRTSLFCVSVRTFDSSLP